MSARALELQSLRRELLAARDLLGQLEARVQALEQEGFEFVDSLPGAEAPVSPSPGSGGGYLSRGSTSLAESGSGGVQLSQAPVAPRSSYTSSGRPGSGGVNLSLAPSAEPGSGGGQLSQAPSPPRLSHASSDRPGSGGVSLSLASDGSVEVYSHGSSRYNPGAPTSQFRTAVAREVGYFLRRALDGGHLRTSGRSALNLSSRYYVVLSDYDGRRCAEPCIFSAFGPCKALCVRGPDKGRSIFVGLPTQTEVAEALRAAELSWPSGGLDVQPSWV